MSQTFSVWTPEQARYAIETVQHFDGWRAASERTQKCSGSMSWKIVRGGTYLVRVHDRRGSQTSLGPRSPETEAIFEQFWRDKQDAALRLRNAEARLTELARMNVALRLGRLPRLPAWLLTALSRKRMLGRYVHVVGTHALYAYEAMAGVRLEPALMETSDLDILADPRRLKLGVCGVAPPRLIDVLRHIDPSFVQEQRSYSVRNKDGFEVDLLKVAERDPMRPAKGRPLADGDIQPVEIINLKWLLHAPKVEAVVIGEDGFPVPMSVPDPRAFALYKFYLSQEPSRDPRKRIRDGAQAEALVSLIEDRLPQYPFDPDQLRMFPAALRHGISSSGNPFWTGAGSDE